MKKIINGRMYNTETAKPIKFYANDGGWRDFRHYEETLYLKRTGEFFVAGEGGPMTKYAQPCGQSGRSSGSDIIPLTEREAKEWAERHMDADEYEETFGEVPE